ncbi:hypothetical protein A3D01_04810 [Candidatus Woesebacteria bacterium RIFCSPHIGHO2_02_FULL_39_13]|uniref:Methyltransferase type 11 domain-containing protein n=1 Tax=Candidatus Woesebacteria bacterium RIFCSPHIGHO2_02_FULL_39_13 TaxID=1802505 RepID=A0A1F7YZZ8_9BACT|nr:MAG: hypothetical protein A2692_00130 [Candidatus Woesebacteria bacterium RIFCSPHIGHO2_01_FULL_39_95]OGM32867.1 MAG: hypothetical protein A3D01_04810 [Candidatus Woesebacteria bacterium RIFCSPHIGHO2_02_FULL_39_13]OGM74380.1 MAG: hypothetical protein A3H19_05120 [Candidatus Woesebacteria bacterium RIFCSPLOWO2_12_FULL_39_9]
MPSLRLIKNIWEKEKYYEMAKEGSLDRKHFGVVLLKKMSRSASSILDLGCGEGTRLDYLTNKKGVGVDISQVAINLARSSHPHLKFIKGNLETLPFKDESFDLVYSAFTLEHLNKPKKVIDEAIRITKPGGNLVFIAPNYGSPNRASPVFKGSRIRKLVNGFLKDVVGHFRKVERLDWLKVQPQTSSYFQDSDTCVEPYIRSLVQYLEGKGVSIKNWSSCWEEELPNPSLLQKLIAGLAKLRIYPFTFWGPHLVVHVQRNYLK